MIAGSPDHGEAVGLQRGFAVDRFGKRRWIVLAIAALLTLLAGCSSGTSTSPSGGSSPVRTTSAKVELSISPEGLQAVSEAAPMENYAIYVSSASLPRSAADLANYNVVDCTGEGSDATARAFPVLVGINTGLPAHKVNVNAMVGENTLAGITKALETKSGDANSLVLVKRASRVPSGATEIVLK